MHQDIFGDLTAREVLRAVAPQTLKSAQVGKPRFGFVQAGTRTPKLSLADKVARLERHPPRMVAPGAPRTFTEEEIRLPFEQYAMYQASIGTGSMNVRRARERLIRSRDLQLWDESSPGELIAKERSRQAIVMRSPQSVVTETVIPSSTEEDIDMPFDPVAERAYLDQLGREMQASIDRGDLIYDLPEDVRLQLQTPSGGTNVSITGTPTSAFNMVIGGITDAITGIATPTGINAITNLIAATQGGSGAVPAALNPMGVRTPFVGGAVLPGGVMAPGSVPAGLGQLLDLPLVDITPQGTSGLGSPFHTTASGNQVAQPFVKSKANGKTEWFIPAGQPKTWTKASRKRAHSHRHHHPR